MTEAFGATHRSLASRARRVWSVREVAIIAVAAAIIGCGGDDHHGGGEGTPTQATCPSTQTLTYANFGQSFMQNYCLTCHSASVTGDARNGAPSDHNFDVLDDIRSLADHIDEYAGSGPAATNTLMPKDDPRPSVEERRKLSEWLACGAPQ